MSMNLGSAFNQWAERPIDERFESLESLRDFTVSRRAGSREATVKFGTLRVIDTGESGFALSGDSGIPAGLTNWSFGQLCSRVGAPAGYLESLNSDRVIDLLNYGLRNTAPADQDRDAKILIDTRGGERGLQVRALTGRTYGRLWDDTIVSECLRLRDHGWRVPPARPAFNDQPGTRPATTADVLDCRNASGLSVNVGDLIAPAGIYCGDRDSFIFMVNEEIRIDDGSGNGLARGAFFENSEVGKRKVKVTAFLYDHVCGNHIVWDAQDVIEISARHVGKAAATAFDRCQVSMREYAQRGAADDQNRITAARETVIAAGMEAVVKAVFQKLRGDVPRRMIAAGWNRAKSDARFDPDTAWGLANGLTAQSQREPNADMRAAADAAAGRILSATF